MSVSKRDQSRRVFILGAGVSASCGIAVTRDILRESILQLPESRLDSMAPVNDLLTFLYPSFDPSLQNYPNVEDFLNQLEMGLLFNEEFIDSSKWKPRTLEKVKQLTLRTITEYLWAKMQSRDALQPLYDFAERLFRPGTVVITFNWDLTVERVWYDQDEIPLLEYLYSRKTKEPAIFLLKPHGSIDWFSPDDLRGTTALKQSERVAAGVPFNYYPYFKLDRAPELLDRVPGIVPPVYAKEVKPFRKIWTSVYRALRDATDIHIIGYSMPKEDQFARFVLRRALRNNILSAADGEKPPLRIEVVNPDPSVEQTFSTLVGHRQGFPHDRPRRNADAVSLTFIQAQFHRYVGRQAR